MPGVKADGTGGMTLRRRQLPSVAEQPKSTPAAASPPRKKQKKDTQKRTNTQTTSKAASSRSARRGASTSAVTLTQSSLTTIATDSLASVVAVDALVLPQTAPTQSQHTAVGPEPRKPFIVPASRLLKRRRSEVEGGEHEGSREAGTAVRLTTLDEREVALREREKALETKLTALEDRNAALQRQEEDAKSVLLISQSQRVDHLLQALEDTFSCSLCYEVVACPYVLKAHRCGHSYCAICILKWYFTHLHRACGAWHDALECPLCRAELPEVPQDPPRSGATCPFAPNRLADEGIGFIVQDLQAILEPVEDEADLPSPGKSKGKGKGKKKSMAPSPVLQDSEQVLGWRKDGSVWTEWRNRDKLGRDKMNDLLARWNQMTTVDFIQFRDGLGV